jgi:hypothetical protein
VAKALGLDVPPTLLPAPMTQTGHAAVRDFCSGNGCHSGLGKMHLGTAGRPWADINHVSTLTSKAPMLNARLMVMHETWTCAEINR